METYTAVQDPAAQRGNHFLLHIRCCELLGAYKNSADFINRIPKCVVHVLLYYVAIDERFLLELHSPYIYVHARSFLLDGLRNILLYLFGERTHTHSMYIYYFFFISISSYSYALLIYTYTR